MPGWKHRPLAFERHEHVPNIHSNALRIQVRLRLRIQLPFTAFPFGHTCQQTFVASLCMNTREAGGCAGTACSMAGLQYTTPYDMGTADHLVSSTPPRADLPARTAACTAPLACSPRRLRCFLSPLLAYCLLARQFQVRARLLHQEVWNSLQRSQAFFQTPATHSAGVAHFAVLRHGTWAGTSSPPPPACFASPPPGLGFSDVKCNPPTSPSDHTEHKVAALGNLQGTAVFGFMNTGLGVWVCNDKRAVMWDLSFQPWLSIKLAEGAHHARA